jgi:phosphatidylglycerol:prolipoprotein diacylglycerol transferase
MIGVMYPILARYGSIFIYSYTVVIAVGVLLAILFMRRSASHRENQEWFSALLAVIVGAILGGRFAFVLWRWEYYQTQIDETWQIWQGGLSYLGALTTSLAALALWARWTGRSFSQYAGFLAPAFVIVSLLGWLACGLEGCAYGQESAYGWLTADLPDEYGVSAVRYQTQLIGFVLTTGALFLVLALRNRLSPAPLFLMALAAVSMVHLVITLIRADPTIIISSYRLDTIANAVLVVASLLLLQYVRMKEQADEESS